MLILRIWLNLCLKLRLDSTIHHFLYDQPWSRTNYMRDMRDMRAMYKCNWSDNIVWFKIVTLPSKGPILRMVIYLVLG